jgi:hypothetical protein
MRTFCAAVCASKGGNGDLGLSLVLMAKSVAHFRDDAKREAHEQTANHDCQSAQCSVLSAQCPEPRVKILTEH